MSDATFELGQMVQAAYQVKPPAVAGQKSGSVRSVQKMFYGFVTGVDTEATPTTFTVYFPEQHDLAEESRTYTANPNRKSKKVIDSLEGKEVIVVKYNVSVGDVLRVDCCGLKDTALCIGTHSPDTAAGELLLLYKSGQLVKESSEALMFVNGSSEKLLAGENLRLQEGLYMLPADKDQPEPPPGCVASTALHKCEYAEIKAKDIAADAGFQKALSKHRFRKSATTAKLFLELLGDAGSSVVQELVRLLQEELEVTNTDKFLKVKDEKKNTVVITRFEGLTLLIHEAQELLKNIADDN